MTKILIIEDEDNLRNNILLILKAEGFESLGAENGRVGVQLAVEKLPDLILCDIMMPEMDGYEVLAQLQANPNTVLIPFIFLTAKSERRDIRQGIELGADDYLTKPFDTEELLGAIATRMKKQEAFCQRMQLLSEELNQLQKVLVSKDEMLENFNQEMRRPLTNLKLAIEQLQQTQDSEKRDRYLEVLRSEFNREIALLDRISALQKLLTPENINLLTQFNMLKQQ